MIYEICNSDIIVHDKTQFNPEHILECGQVFRYGKDENGNYFVISNHSKATIIEFDDYYKIVSDDPTYFVHYFDLDTDYNKIKNVLRKNKVLAPMIDYGYGIRILNGDSHEMIFSYIISQNNNIPRIKKIIEKLCEIGTENNGFHNFPTIDELAAKPLEFYQGLGAGYRDKFLKETADRLLHENMESLLSMDSDTLLNFLVSLKGVGKKVASCIMLYGFGKKDKFPVDTWIEQVYYSHFSKEKRTRVQIQKYFEDEFGEFSGIAQQYLFYYERNNPSKNAK